MPDFNKVILMGRMTADAELKYTTTGTPVCNLRMAINRKWKDKDGGEKEEVAFVTVVAWRKQAEAAGSWLKKGDPLFVEGRLQSGTWETEQKEKRTKLEVVADNIKFLSGKAKPEQGQDTGTSQPTDGVAEEDIPF